MRQLTRVLAGGRRKLVLGAASAALAAAGLVTTSIPAYALATITQININNSSVSPGQTIWEASGGAIDISMAADNLNSAGTYNGCAIYAENSPGASLPGSGTIGAGATQVFSGFTQLTENLQAATSVICPSSGVSATSYNVSSGYSTYQLGFLAGDYEPDGYSYVTVNVNVYAPVQIAALSPSTTNTTSGSTVSFSTSASNMLPGGYVEILRATSPNTNYSSYSAGSWTPITSCSNGASFTSCSASDSQTVTTTSSYQYIAFADAGSGPALDIAASSPVTVTYTAAQPQIQSFNASPSSQTSGSSVTLSAVAVNASSGVTIYKSTSPNTDGSFSTEIGNCSGSGTVSCTATDSETATTQTTWYYEAVSGSATAVTSVTYTVPAPTVAGVSPSSGQAGSSVTVSGSNLSGGTVEFNGSPASGSSCSSTSCTATVPSGSGTETVTVSTSSGSSNGVSFTFTVPAPTVTGVSPSSGSTAGGTTVTVTGTGFSTSSGATTVDFGSAAATGVSCSSATSCTATSPSANAGVVDVTVTVGGATSSTSSADQFTYVTPTGSGGGSTTASATLSAGTLAFGSTPPPIAWTVTLTGLTQQAYTTTEPVSVVDSTGSGAGWALDVTASQLCTSNCAESLPEGATSLMPSPSVTCASTASDCVVGVGSALRTPVTITSGSGTSPGSVTQLFSAEKGSGMGAQVVSLDLGLAVPSSALAGDYSATWTFSLIAGP